MKIVKQQLLSARMVLTCKSLVEAFGSHPDGLLKQHTFIKCITFLRMESISECNNVTMLQSLCRHGKQSDIGDEKNHLNIDFEMDNELLIHSC